MDPEEFRTRAKSHGYTDAEIEAYLAKQGPDTSVSAANLGRSAVQGATFNFGDEILGVLPEWLGGGEKARDEMRANDKAFSGEHPWISGAANVAGGLALPGVGAWKAIGSGVKTIGQAAKVGGLLGGASGALAGAGASEGDLGDRAQSAVVPGLLGAGLGAVVPGGIAAGKAAFGAAARAGSKIERAMARTGGPAAALAQAKALEAAGRGSEAILGDLSPALRQATDMAVNTSDEAAEKIGNIVYGRQADAGERILRDVRAVVGDPQAGSIVDDLAEQTRQWADSPRGFEGLRQANPVILPGDAKAFGKFLNSPRVVDAWSQAREVGLIGPMPKPGPISFEVLQGVKERLGSAADAAFRSGRGDLGRRLKDATEVLVGEMETSVPGYKEVAAEYAKRKGLERAVEAGQEAWKTTDSRGLVTQVAKMAAPELEKFRAGMASELITQLRAAGTNRDLAKQLTQASPAMREKIETVFGSRPAFERFVAQMTAERELSKQLGSLGGSQTARRIAAREVDPLEVGLDLASAPVAPWSAMSRLASVVRGGVGGKVQQGAAKEMGDLLSTQGTPDIEKLLLEWGKRPSLLGRGTSSLLPTGLGIAGQGLLSD